MALSETSYGKGGWKRWLIAVWAFIECFLFAGILLGWGSLVFVLKDEGIFAELCSSAEISALGNKSTPTQKDNSFNPDNITNATEATNDLNSHGFDNTTHITLRKQCRAQDDRFALCFTIASATFCIGAAILGHINFKFGTRATRVFGL